MAMREDEIVSLIKQALPDAIVEMTDLAGDNDHWKAVVTSSKAAWTARAASYMP